MKKFNQLFALLLFGIGSIAVNAQNGSLPKNVDTRQVFCLSMLSNIPAQTTGGVPIKNTAKDASKTIINYSTPIIDNVLLNAVDNSVPNQPLSLNNWKRLWGPGVIAIPSNGILFLDGLPNDYVSAVSMTIFQDVKSNNFVVAIQATNPYSVYAWSVLDFGVDKTVSWDGTQSHGVISKGTNTGLNHLLSLKDINDKNGINVLKKECDKNSNVVVTGHSLGGALSPVLALKLKGMINANVYCLSTAGATPGDANFANYYDQQLQSNTVRIWNKFDVIPHAWDTAVMNTMMSVKGSGGIYSAVGTSNFFDSSYLKCKPNKPQPSPFANMPTPSYINSMVNWAKRKTKGVPYTAICDSGASFNGAAANTGGTNYYLDVVPLDTSLWSLIDTLARRFTKDKIVVTDGYFLPEMGAQHVSAYTYEFQMKQIHEYIRHQIESNSNSIVNMCGKLDAFNKGFKTLSKPEVLKKNKIDPYALFRALVYKQAWKL